MANILLDIYHYWYLICITSINSYNNPMKKELLSSLYWSGDRYRYPGQGHKTLAEQGIKLSIVMQPSCSLPYHPDPNCLSHTHAVVHVSCDWVLLLLPVPVQGPRLLQPVALC